MGENTIMNWQTEPPDSTGFWWLYGDDEFGVMGGNYTGSIPAENKLHIIDVWKIGSGDNESLQGVSSGRFISLTPFDKDKRKPGYVGVWQKVILPKLP